MDIQNEILNAQQRKDGKEIDEEEIKKLVDHQEKKSNRFIQSLRLPNKDAKPKIDR